MGDRLGGIAAATRRYVDAAIAAISGSLRYDQAQALSAGQKTQIASNAGIVQAQRGLNQDAAAHDVRLGWDGTRVRVSVDGTVDTGPLWSDGAAASSFATSGYERLPNGKIKQWTRFTADGSGYFTWVFPTAFPHAVLSIMGVPVTQTGLVALGVYTDATLTQATFRLTYYGGGVVQNANGVVAYVEVTGW